MNNQINFQWRIWGSTILLSLSLLFPVAVYAHLISITATTPFPATVPASSSITATFTIKNITTSASVTVVDQSSFPPNGTLSISSNTCGNLAPQQSCVIQVLLRAPTAGRVILGTLKEWASPTADGVQYPISVIVSANSLPNITLQRINDNNGLPPLRGPVMAESSGNWLIMSGTTGNFHDFNYNDFITSIYVYNPNTNQMYSKSASSLPAPVRHQLISSDPEFVQDGDTLYIIGGYFTSDNVNWTTLNTITAINVPGMINAIINNSDITPFVTYNTSITQFKVAGGQVDKIGNDFYLAYGQDCEGNYCATSQTYTNTIYQFSTDPTLSSINIINSVTHGDLDGSGWRRRDYTLTPIILNNTPALLALGGPFTPGEEADVWTNAISFLGNLQYNNNFLNQKANQYSAPVLPMYSTNQNTSYVATFSGLSNLYRGLNGLVYDNTTPYGNILDLISADGTGNVQEYANETPLCSGQPLASCLYMGLAAYFIPIDNYYDSRGILQLDQLPQNTPTLVGYVYGGIVSSGQDIFDAAPNNATNQIYAVYVTPAGSGTVSWDNVSNFPTT